MKSLLLRLARWLIARLDPAPDLHAPDIFAVCSHSKLHGARAEVVACGEGVTDLKAQALDLHARAYGTSKVVRVLRYSPVAEWMPGDGP